ncbi:MAG: sugar phosphate nucleotidyltransferase, partial [Candidatus Daviesbacteria bacterium]|nr:sugar phosphate nucleotidyltransferase [Candidatus Daviesbacteria bacterium]
MQINQAVILAGGQGTRLKPFTNNNPKPMVPVNDKPFLEYLIDLLKENSIKEVITLTGYFGEKIEKYFGNGSKLGIDIKYSYTPFLDEKGEENKSG